MEVYNILENPQKAIKDLQSIIHEKFDENLVNLVCDLYIQLKQFQACIEFLESLGQQEFAVDIETKRGVCFAKVGRLQEAEESFDKLYQQRVNYYDDLYWLVGCLYQELDYPEQALRFLEGLRVLDHRDKPTLWIKCGQLYLQVTHT